MQRAAVLGGGHRQDHLEPDRDRERDQGEDQDRAADAAVGRSPASMVSSLAGPAIAARTIDRTRTSGIANSRIAANAGRQPLEAVRDRLADAGRAAPARGASRRAGRPARRTATIRASDRHPRRRRLARQIRRRARRLRRSACGSSTSSASATAPISRPSRARTSLVSSHAFEIDNVPSCPAPLLLCGPALCVSCGRADAIAWKCPATSNGASATRPCLMTMRWP